jgi:hypothetical protein
VIHERVLDSVTMSGGIFGAIGLVSAVTTALEHHATLQEAT